MVFDQTTYERIGTAATDSGSLEVYSPEPAWFAADIGRSYRITNTDGQVHVDAATGDVVSANVTFEKTPGEHYGDYLQNRDDTVTFSIHYERSPAPETVDRPDWVLVDQSAS